MWLDMDEIESFCDGRCSIDFEVEDVLFANDTNSLYTCSCPTQPSPKPLTPVPPQGDKATRPQPANPI